MLLAAGDMALGGCARERSTANNLKRWFSGSPGVCFNPLNSKLCSSRDVSVTFSQQERAGLQATSVHQQHAGPAASMPGGRLPFVGLKSHKPFLVRADGCAGGVPQKITWLKKVFQEHSLPLMGLPVLQMGWFCCSLIKRIIFLMSSEIGLERGEPQGCFAPGARGKHQSRHS